MEAVRAEAAGVAPGIEIFEQATQAGTGHAVLAARPALERHTGRRDRAVRRYAAGRAGHAAQADRRRSMPARSIAALGFEPADAERLRPPDRRSRRARAARSARTRDATRGGAAHRPVQRGRDGVPRARTLPGCSARIGNANAKGEYYLTDVVALAAARRAGHRGRSPAPAEEALGVNSREQLAAAEAVFQRRARRRAMEQGATLMAPETVWLSFDTVHRPRRDHRAQRVLRPRRGGGGRRPHHGQLPHGRRAHPQGRARRPVRPLPPRRRHRRRRARRQLRRGQERHARRRAPRPTISPTSATGGSARAPTSAPAPSSATTTASTSTSPTSARARSSAPTPRWWRPSRSATAPTSARAASSARTWRPTPWRWSARPQEQRPGWAAKFRALMGRRKKTA